MANVDTLGRCRLLMVIVTVTVRIVAEKQLRATWCADGDLSEVSIYDFIQDSVSAFTLMIQKKDNIAVSAVLRRRYCTKKKAAEFMRCAFFFDGSSCSWKRIQPTVK